MKKISAERGLREISCDEDYREQQAAPMQGNAAQCGEMDKRPINQDVAQAPWGVIHQSATGCGPVKYIDYCKGEEGQACGDVLSGDQEA